MQLPGILLQISKTETNFTTFFDNESNQLQVKEIHVGYQLIADQCFSAFPPTFNEMDNAINIIEEAVVTLHDQIDIQLSLFCADDDLKNIARLAFNTINNADGTQTIRRIEVENLFTRLAEIIKGLPPSQDVLPKDNHFAAYLLILREIMHHLGFECIVLL